MSEMVDLLMLELIDKGLVTDQLVLTVGYDIDNISSESHMSEGTYKEKLCVTGMEDGYLSMHTEQLILAGSHHLLSCQRQRF